MRPILIISLALAGASLSAPASFAQTTDVQGEVAALKAENAAVRDLLRQMADQQKVLLDQVDRLQRRLDALSTTTPAGVAAPQPSAPQPAAPAAATKDDHYQDGIVIWQNPEGAKVPFLLKFNNNTQIRYLNTVNSDGTFTDHLG